MFSWEVSFEIWQNHNEFAQSIFEEYNTYSTNIILQNTLP